VGSCSGRMGVKGGRGKIVELDREAYVCESDSSNHHLKTIMEYRKK